MGLLSSSKSSSNQTNNDGRVTAGDEATALSLTGSSNSTINATTTDFGSVSKSLDLAMKGVDSSAALATNVVNKTLDGSFGLLKGSMSMLGDQQDKFTSAFTSQGSAFGTALENVKTSDTRVLILSGLAVVGLVGLTLARKG